MQTIWEPFDKRYRNSDLQISMPLFWHLTASPYGATTGQGGAGEKPCLHTRQLLMQRT